MLHCYHVTEYATDIEEAALSQLLEWVFEYEMSEKDYKRGRTRRVASQYAIETISIHELLHLLGVIGRLQTCSEFKDVASLPQ